MGLSVVAFSLPYSLAVPFSFIYILYLCEQAAAGLYEKQFLWLFFLITSNISLVSGKMGLVLKFLPCNRLYVCISRGNEAVEHLFSTIRYG